MTAEFVVGLMLTWLVMGVGLVGAVVPVVPGPILIWLAALLHRWWFGSSGASTWVLGLMTGLVILVTVLEVVAGSVGAQRFGATWRGGLGALLGGVVGLFLGPVGILAGPFVGAVIGEMLGGRDFRGSGRAGLGTLLGLVAGMVGKVAACVAMMALFSANVLYKVLQAGGR